MVGIVFGFRHKVSQTTLNLMSCDVYILLFCVFS